jgi:hypothetical protein
MNSVCRVDAITYKTEELLRLSVVLSSLRAKMLLEATPDLLESTRLGNGAAAIPKTDV